MFRREVQWLVPQPSIRASQGNYCIFGTLDRRSIKRRPGASMKTRHIANAGFMLFLAASGVRGAGFHLRRATTTHSSGVSLRKRLHVNDLIAEPGTMELDWSSLYSYTTGLFSMP